MFGLIQRSQWKMLGLVGFFTLALWAVIILRFVGLNNIGSITSSIVIGILFSMSSFVSSRGFGWDLLTKISMRIEYDYIFAPGYDVATPRAISRLFYLLLFSIIILAMVSNSIISGQNWLVALTTAATIVSIEMLLEFVSSNDDRGIEIGPPHSYTYVGVSKKPLTLREIQKSAENDPVEATVRSHLEFLEKQGHIESKKISGQQVWWKKE